MTGMYGSRQSTSTPTFEIDLANGRNAFGYAIRFSGRTARIIGIAIPLLVGPLGAGMAAAAVLTVGPSGTYQHVQDAINAANAGDTIDVQAGTYNDEYFDVTKALTIQGVNGTVLLTNDQPIPNGKAEAVVDADLTISNFAFSGAQVTDDNGAGIRYDTGNLVVEHCYFYDNQEGILGAAAPTGTIVIDSSEFSHNGIGDGYTHAIYIGEIASLTVTNSYFHDTPVGHYIKSRANATLIQGNGIMDGWTGTSSYDIDVPDGGATIIRLNVIEQGPQTQNPAMIHFGGETPTPYPGSHLQIRNNTIINDDPSGSAVGVYNQTQITAQIVGNKIWGLSAAQVASGPNSQSSNQSLTTEPTIQLWHIKYN